MPPTLHVSMYLSESPFEEENDPSLFIFPREEKFYWSLSSAQIVPENAMLLDLIAWMRNERKKGIKGMGANETYCHQSMSLSTHFSFHLPLQHSSRLALKNLVRVIK